MLEIVCPQFKKFQVPYIHDKKKHTYYYSISVICNDNCDDFACNICTRDQRYRNSS